MVQSENIRRRPNIANHSVKFTFADLQLTNKAFNKELGKIAVSEGYPNGMLIKELIAIGYRRGYKRGLRRVLMRQIVLLFGKVPAAIRRYIEKTNDIERLESIAKTLPDLQNFQQIKKLIESNGKSALYGRNGAKTKGIVKAAHGVSRSLNQF